MRDAFANEITALAQTDPAIVLLSGDIGNRMFNKFKAACPDRFFNCGVAEANMTGVAAGLATCGLKPFTYTITPFVTTRCLEQIRVDVCYHHLPVTIVAVGAGFCYASLGATHHACEDIAFLRSLPDMTVVCPGDAHEVRLAVRAAATYGRPLYLRLGKKGEPVVHGKPPEFVIGKGIILQSGDEVCLLSTGNILPVALAAGQRLREQGVSTRVVSLHTVKPLDPDLLGEGFSRFRVVATVEEHSLIGGLGGAVAEWLADHGPGSARLCRIGAPDEFIHKTGEQEYVRHQLGLTPEHIAERIQSALKTSSR
jgi:transketolase